MIEFINENSVVFDGFEVVNGLRRSGEELVEIVLNTKSISLHDELSNIERWVRSCVGCY